MKIFNLPKIITGAALGLGAAGIIIIVFSALFSYTREINTTGALLFIIALLLTPGLSKQNNYSTGRKTSGEKRNWLTLLIIAILPVIFAPVLIQGNFWSWVLVFLTILITWLVTFPNNN